MDLSYTLTWMVGMASVVGLIAMLARHRFQYPGWIAVYTLNAAAVAALAYLTPENAGFIATALWVPTALAPTLGVRYASRLVAMQRYTAARRVLQVLAVLHPFDGWRDQPAFMLALSLLQRGERERAAAIFERAKGRDTWLGRMALLHLHRMRGRWDEIRRWFEEQPKKSEVARDVTAISFYLRALGELHDAPALVRAYCAAATKRELAAQLSGLQLFVASFVGRTDLVEQLFAGALGHYPEELKAYWRATSLQAAGDSEAATEKLEPIVASGTPLVRAAAKLRLSEPAQALEPDALDDEAKRAIDAMAREIAAVQRARTAPRHPPIATLTFLLINTIVFIGEIGGGSTSGQNLCGLGALILTPNRQFQGEWWRVLTACFLHFGPLHLVMNLVGLLVLGWRLERVTGARRFAIVYLAAGFGGDVIYALTASLRGQFGFLVGASGSVMGVVGAITAVLLRRWQRDRTRASAAQIAPLAVMIVAQSIFDIATPNVAMLVHLSGALIGFVVGYALGEPAARSESESESEPAKPAASRRAVLRSVAVAALLAALALTGFAWAVEATAERGTCSEIPGEI